MNDKEYTGRSAAMRTSPWLAAEDLDGLGDVEVTIEEDEYDTSETEEETPPPAQE